MPSAVDDPLIGRLSAEETVEKLRDAVTKSATDLCALSGADQQGVKGCEIEFKDLGVAVPSVRPVPEARPQNQEAQADEESETSDSRFSVLAVVIVVAVISAVKLALCFRLLQARKGPAQDKASADSEKAAKTKEAWAATSMEEGKAPVLKVAEKEIDEKQKPVEDDSSSTQPPASDKQSEPSINGDCFEKASNHSGESGLSVVSALSQQGI